jgi:hypothetical protein
VPAEQNANTLKATLTGDDQWSDPIRIADSSFELSLYGDFDGEVSLQRKLNGDDDSEYHTLKTYKGGVQDIITDRLGAIGSWQYRVGFDTDGHKSGTLKVAASECQLMTSPRFTPAIA